MHYSGTDPESYITEYTLVYEDNKAIGHVGSCQVPPEQLWELSRNRSSSTVYPADPLRIRYPAIQNTTRQSWPDSDLDFLF